MRIKSVFKHSGQAALEGALVSLLVVGLMAGTAFAAKGGGGGKGKPVSGSGTISLAAIVVDKNGNGLPNWSDVVTFNISTATTQPWVHVMCSQNGAVIAQGWAGYFEGALGTRNFGLSSPSWPGGAADCKANLETSSGSVLGTTSFHVGA